MQSKAKVYYLSDFVSKEGFDEINDLCDIKPYIKAANLALTENDIKPCVGDIIHLYKGCYDTIYSIWDGDRLLPLNYKTHDDGELPILRIFSAPDRFPLNYWEKATSCSSVPFYHEPYKEEIIASLRLLPAKDDENHDSNYIVAGQFTVKNKLYTIYFSDAAYEMEDGSEEEFEFMRQKIVKLYSKNQTLLYTIVPSCFFIETEYLSPKGYNMLYRFDIIDNKCKQ
jgi:hypothetical protein